MNELKCYKLEITGQTQQPTCQPQAQMPFGAPQSQGGGEADDLPF